MSATNEDKREEESVVRSVERYPVAISKWEAKQGNGFEGSESSDDPTDTGEGAESSEADGR